MTREKRNKIKYKKKGTQDERKQKIGESEAKRRRIHLKIISLKKQEQRTVSLAQTDE